MSGFIRTDYHCPQRRLCKCFIAFHNKEYAHKIELYAAGTHTSESHIRSSAQLTQHQKHAISTAVGASPLATGYSVHQNLGNVGMNVSNDKVTRAAVGRLVRKERRRIMHAETGEKKMDETIAAMVEIGRMMHIEKVIKDHNSYSDFHLNLSKFFITNLENKGFKTLEQLREAVDPVRQEYQSMMVNMDEFMTENPQFTKEPGAIMDIMDSFYRLITLPVKVGPMCFMYQRFCVLCMRALHYCNNVV